MIALNDQIAQGTSDSSLANDVRTLNSLSLAKDQATQQRALLYNALTQQFFADDELQALTTAESEAGCRPGGVRHDGHARRTELLHNTVAGPQVNRAE